MTKLNLYSKEQIDALNIGKETDAASATGSLWARMKNALTRIGTAETNITNLGTSKADDNAVVKLTGDQTISDTKTFNSSPIVPDDPSTHGAVNNAYVNDSTDGVNNIVHKTGNEIINGIKSFKSSIYRISPYNYDGVFHEAPLIRYYASDGTTEVCTLWVTQNSNNRSTIYAKVRNTDGTLKTVVIAEGDVI